LAFYLVIALRAALRAIGWWKRGRPEPNLKAYCDLVAIGTMADMVPLRKVNRILVCAGLEQINNVARTGIQALLKSSGIRHTPINADDIAYRLAPRINAAGRLNTARIAFDLLNSDNLEFAFSLADDLGALNQRRQQMENDIYGHITRHLESRSDLLDRKALVLAGAQWHEGVIGIVAAKLVARYHRPVLVVSAKDDLAKGSGRSVPQIDLYAAVAKCAHLLEAYGGHRLAAGISLQTKNIGKLQAAFEAAVEEMTPSQGIGPELTIDHELQLDQICPQLIDELEWLSPFGTENPAPLFMAREVKVTRAAIVGQRHRRMQLCQANQCSPPIGAIEFNLSQEAPRAEAFEQLAFRLQWNRYRGEKEIQMVIEAY
jgi:single-stranded-DNA-specific exonuclease